MTEEQQEMFDYLDELRESGAINMVGAASFVVNKFGCSLNIARKVLAEWIKTR